MSGGGRRSWGEGEKPEGQRQRQEPASRPWPWAGMALLLPVEGSLDQGRSRALLPGSATGSSASFFLVVIFGRMKPGGLRFSV